MNDEIKRLNYLFESQSATERKRYRIPYHQETKSDIDQKLFKHHLSLGLDDWRKIRSGDYYDIVDKKTGIERSKFILQKIEEYLDSK